MRPLTARPTKDGHHPKYRHLIYVEVDTTNYGAVSVTSPYVPELDLFFQSEEQAIEFLEDAAALDRGYCYLSSDCIYCMCE